MRITQKHAIEEQLRQGARGAVLVVLKKSPVSEELAALAKTQGIPVRMAKDARRAEAEKGYYLELADRVTGERNWGELLAEWQQADKVLVLVLDGVEDPQNYGAILRSADQFRVDAVVSPQRRSAGLSPGAMAASSGAHAWVNRCTVPNLARALEDLKKAGFWVYGADMDGKPLPDIAFPPKTALVLGSEGKGLGRLVRESCDEIVSIPTQGHIDSLNVSVAAGILLYAVRTRSG